MRASVMAAVAAVAATVGIAVAAIFVGNAQFAAWWTRGLSSGGDGASPGQHAYDPRDMTTWSRDQRRATMQAQYEAQYQASLLDADAAGTDAATLLLRLAYVHDRRGNLTEAARLYSEVIATQRSQSDTGSAGAREPPVSVYHNLALVHARLGNASAALSVLADGLAAVNATSAAATAAAAAATPAAPQPATALDTHKTIAGSTTGGAGAGGSGSAIRGDAATALTRRSRRAALLHYARGSLLLLNSGRARLAEQAFTRAHAADPVSDAAAANLAMTRRELGGANGHPVALQPLLDAALAANPQQPSHALEAAVNLVEVAVAASSPTWPSPPSQSSPSAELALSSPAAAAQAGAAAALGKVLESRVGTDRALSVVKAAVLLHLGRAFAAHDVLESRLVRELRLHGVAGRGDLAFHRAVAVGGICTGGSNGGGQAGATATNHASDFVRLLANPAALTGAVVRDGPGSTPRDAWAGAAAAPSPLDFWRPRLARRFGYAALRAAPAGRWAVVLQPGAAAGRGDDGGGGTAGVGFDRSRLAVQHAAAHEVVALLGDEMDAADPGSDRFEYFTLADRGAGAEDAAAADDGGGADGGGRSSSGSGDGSGDSSSGSLDAALPDELLRVRILLAVTSLRPLRVWAHPAVCTTLGRAHGNHRDTAECAVPLADALESLRRRGAILPTATDIVARATAQAQALVAAAYSVWEHNGIGRVGRGGSGNGSSPAAASVSMCPIKLLAVDLRLLSDHRLVTVGVLDRPRFEPSLACADGGGGSSGGGACFGGRLLSKELIGVSGADGAHEPWHRRAWAAFGAAQVDQRALATEACRQECGASTDSRSSPGGGGGGNSSSGTAVPPSAQTRPELAKLLREFTRRGRFRLLLPAADSVAQLLAATARTAAPCYCDPWREQSVFLHVLAQEHAAAAVAAAAGA